MSGLIARIVYRLVTWIALPCALVYFFWRGRAEPAYRHHWRERLGHGPRRTDSPLWIHAASVGEVILACSLIETLLEKSPNQAIVLTTFTPTGRAEAARRLGQRVERAYVPLDSRGATRRFIQRIAPAAGLFIETELWPHLIGAAARANVPLALVNACISEKSAATYGKWPLAALMRDVLPCFDLVAATEEEHARRLISLGAPSGRVRVTGNLKYDRPESPQAQEQADVLRRDWQAMQRPIFLAASTHEPEEAELLAVFRELREAFPALLWVVAPRHPQRFDAVARLVGDSGWCWARRSKEEAVTGKTDIVLADTLGELDLFYALSDVAFVGGSLAPGIGGHNVIEAAAAARVVVTGPHIREWREPLSAMAEAGGAVVAQDIPTLVAAISRWLADPAQRIRDGQAIAEVAAGHRGALQRTTELLEGLLASSLR